MSRAVDAAAKNKSRVVEDISDKAGQEGRSKLEWNGVSCAVHRENTLDNMKLGTLCP